MTREEFINWFEERFVLTKNDIYEFGQLYDEVTKPHWISVEDDGNPIDTGWYIFTVGKIVDVGYYLGGNEWRDVHPTHWMPKPEAPHHFADVSQKVKKGGEK